MKKFRTFYNEKIEEIETLKETEKSVTYLNGDRHPRMTNDFYCHFDTWQEAKDFLIDRENTAIAKLLNEVKQHQDTLEKIEAMQL
ncbi:hypothetical protein M0R72_08300 [Candidatus Pacearchaeota archaeon]|jgi:hypothetical protein|nr:hypothetical protein [Candidatus Pacearchaeota archaeon]